MSKRLLVKQCSPTMAGLKTGNLFTCEAKSRPDLVRFVRAINRKFAYKGLKMAIMRYSSGRALIYMYKMCIRDRISILITLGVSLAVSFMVARKNKNIDMVEALKGAE